jgi:hypothetical protein
MSAEHLTDGWEPDLPVSDTLLRRFLFNLAAFHEAPAVAAGGRVLRRGELLDERVLDEERLRLWVGYEGGRPVCIGSLFVDAGVASFSLGVTLPEARRRGYWAAMAGVRLVDAPGLPAVGVFSDMSRPGAEALGFLPVTRFTLWHRPRP